MFSPETEHTINGVPGRMYARHVRPDRSDLFSAQKWFSERRACNGYGKAAELQVEIRFDDSCKNGYASFAITGTVSTPTRRKLGADIIAAGCLHDEIAAAFPELAHLIKWHLCATDGPMHYVANTLYHAGDRDHNGLRAGESRQIRNGRTGGLCWTLEAVQAPGIRVSTTPTGQKYEGKETVPLYLLETSVDGDQESLPPVPALRWTPMLRVGDGKPRDLDAARRSAVWPEASDAELTVEPEELRAKLEARLPLLLGVFRSEMSEAGLLWEPTARDA